MINPLKAILKKKESFKIDAHAVGNFRCRYIVTDADEFYKFLTTTAPGQTASYLDIINAVNKYIRYDDINDLRKVRKDKALVRAVVKDFFREYMPEKSNEVDQIVDGTHPAFVDQKGKKHVYIKKVWHGEKSSGVSHVPGQDFLSFTLYLHGDINDYIAAVHEMSHAISADMQDSLSGDKKTKDLLCKSPAYFSKDCVCEIESHITERLFCEYMREKGKFSAQDVKDFEDDTQESLYFHTHLLSEEQAVVAQVPEYITKDTLQNLYNKLQEQNNNHVTSRFKKMCHGFSFYNSKYVFRYFVANIVADQWIKEYRSSSEAQKQAMRATFQDYLDKTTDIDLNDACQMLMGQHFDKIAINYINDLKQNNKEQTTSQDDNLDEEDIFVI